MKAMWLAALVTVSLAASLAAKAGPPSNAGNLIWATIVQIRIDKDGFATVFFTGYLWVEGVACREADMDHALAFDSKTEAGRNLLAVMLDAKSNGYSITGKGTGTCITINGKVVETVNYLVVT